MGALVFSMLLFAASFTLTKIAYADVGPFVGHDAFRGRRGHLVGVAGGWHGRRRPITRADARLLAIGGLLGVTAYFALENLGVAWTTATDASLLGAAYPAIIVAMDALLNHAHVSRRVARDRARHAGRHRHPGPGRRWT